LPLIFGLAVIALSAAVIVFTAPRSAEATPKFAKETHLPCTRCHTSAASGALNSFGEEFKHNGFKLRKRK
jgi:hypothetical protein